MRHLVVPLILLRSRSSVWAPFATVGSTLMEPSADTEAARAPLCRPPCAQAKSEVKQYHL